MAVYEASRLTGGNHVFPNKIEIDDEGLTFYKGSVIGYKTTRISKKNIGSISLSSGLIFCTITIESSGGRTIVADGFTRDDGNEIKEWLDRCEDDGTDELYLGQLKCIAQCAALRAAADAGASASEIRSLYEDIREDD